MKKVTLLALISILVTTNFWGQDDKTPKYSNEFLNIGVGARALAMSNSIIASSNDVTSGYWNPVGLTNIESDLQFGLMHAEYFAGIAKYDFGAVAKRIDDKSAMSFSIIRFGVDNIPNTTELIDNQGNIDYGRITYFTAADLGLVFSYGRNINDNFSVGGSAKIINRKVGSFAKSWGFGLDFSAVYRLNDWTFAVMGRDITTTFNAWSYTLSDRTIEVFTQTGNEIPQNGLEITMPRIILGAARSWQLGEKFGLLAEIDTDVTTDGKRNTLIVGNPFSIDPHLGLEFDFKKLVYLRAGIGNIQRITQLNGKESMTVQPNIGIGVKFKGIAIDYALTDIGDASVALYSNIFSLRFDLNPKKPEKGSFE